MVLPMRNMESDEHRNKRESLRLCQKPAHKVGKLLKKSVNEAGLIKREPLSLSSVFIKGLGSGLTPFLSIDAIDKHDLFA